MIEICLHFVTAHAHELSINHLNPSATKFTLGQYLLCLHNKRENQQKTEDYTIYSFHLR